MQPFGAQLATARKEKGMTQEQLADAMHVTRPAVSHWENGRTLPDWENINQLSLLLNYRFTLPWEVSREKSESENGIKQDDESLPLQDGANTARQTIPSQGWFSWRCVSCFVAGVIVTAAMFIGLTPQRGNPASTESAQETPVYIDAPSTLNGYRQQVAPVDHQALIHITATENPVPLVEDDNFSNGQGWHFTFALTNPSEITFTVKELMVVFFVGEQIESRSYFSDEQLEMQLGDGVIQPGESPYLFAMGANNRGQTGVGCSVKGIDAHGNTLEFHGYVELKQTVEE